MQMKGIDVSSYQGDIDFEQVKNGGIDFVIIKAGEWNHTVDKFEENYAAAKAAGLHVGFYWFCDGETIAEIEEEADACIKALEGKQFDFPIYMDIENRSQYDLGKDFCSEAVRVFCEKLEAADYYTGLYCAASWLDNVIDDDIKDKYTVWVADWRGYCGYDGKYGMWQYGAGYVPGIGGKTDLNIIDIGYNTDYPGSVVTDGVDLDYAYEDFPSLIIPNGLNNYPKPTQWEDDECREIGNNLDIKGYTPKHSGDNWFLIDENCEFTLETLPYAKVRLYLVGGGQKGAEWYDISHDNVVGYDISQMGRGGAVCVKDITITGNVSCKAYIAEPENFKGTALVIGNDVHKCDDEGYIWRKATASGRTSTEGTGATNAESGANGVATPYGYVGSSGGGGGGYTLINGQRIQVYAGKGGAGAGNGGNIKEDGQDAQNYGCGGGAAGFGGFPGEHYTVETHCGKGMGGCVIFEILDSGACDGSPNKPVEDSGSCGCGCNCGCGHHEFECPDPPESSSHSEQESETTLKYDGDKPVVIETNYPIISTSTGQTSSGSSIGGSANSSGCGCSSSSKHNSSATYSGNSCRCGSSGGKSRCVSYDVSKWGDNWLLFDKTGEYSLTFDEDMDIDLYLVGGGCDGKDGLYYNQTAYGGEGGRGGTYNVVEDVSVPKGETTVTVRIGGRGNVGGTSVIINNNEYCCSGSGSESNNGGFQGISGKHGYQNAGNGSNGIETPFGYIGSSGGAGGAYCRQQTAGYGKGGLYAGNGGKIVNGKSTPGDRATGYGCGGGGGAASSTSWCSGGKGRQGCVIINW